MWWTNRRTESFWLLHRFVKRLRTFSIALMSFKNNRFHITLQYSKIGPTYTVKALTSNDRSGDITQRMIRFARLWALPTIPLIWLENFNLLSITAPRSTTFSTVQQSSYPSYTEHSLVPISQTHYISSMKSEVFNDLSINIICVKYDDCLYYADYAMILYSMQPFEVWTLGDVVKGNAAFPDFQHLRRM